MSNKILKLPEVMQITALSRSSIYSFCQENTFPKPISLGARAVGWVESEVLSWINQKVESREVSK